jgi:hypothetical protein
MLISGGLFTAVAAFVTLERVPAWRLMSWPEFQNDFVRWIRWADRVQPGLLLVCLAATIRYAAVAQGPAGGLAATAAAALFLILVGSVALLVPVQRQLIRGASRDRNSLRRRWYRGHLVRTTLAATALTLLVLASTV